MADPPSTDILTTDTRPAPTAEPIHANSHAAHLQDPSRTSTSNLTLEAFRKHHLLETIISAVTSPLPYGEDGEHTEADVDFEEKALRSVRYFLMRGRWLIYVFIEFCIFMLCHVEASC